MAKRAKYQFDDGGKINVAALGQAANGIGGVFGTLIDSATFDPSIMGADDKASLETLRDLDFNATDYGDLYAQVSNLPLIKNDFKSSDYYSPKSGLEYFLDFNKDTLAGAGVGGSIGGPWGALIGGIVGSASNIAGSTWGYNKKKEGAEQAAKDNIALADSVNRALSLKISNSANNLNTQNVSNMLLHTGAFGGILETKGANWNSGASFIDNGGTHEQNPNEGVQFGIAPDGLPNLVEEGEVIIKVRNNIDQNHSFAEGGSPTYDDYVLSNREFGNLEEIANAKITSNPEKYVGRSYAEIYKDLFSKSSLKEIINRKDTKDYIDSLNERIANAQEATKQREFIENLAKLTAEQRDYVLQQMGNNNLIEAAAYAAKGGKIYIKPKNRGKFNATKKRTGKTTEELTHSKNPLTRKRAIFAKNAKKWKHSDGGHLFVMGGPDENEFKWSFYNNNNNDFYFPYVHYATEENKPMTLYEAPWYYTLLNTDTAQDPVNKNIPIKIIEPIKKIENQNNPVVENIIVPNTLNESIDRLHGRAFGDLSQNLDAIDTALNTREEPEERENTSVYPTWTRAVAPLAGNLIGLGYTLTHTPDNKYADQYEQAAKDYVNNIREVGYTPLSEELTYKPIDTAYYINELLSSQAANRNALMNLSNSNPNVTAANLLASNYNSNIELGNLMKEAELADLERREKSLTFNRETHRLNRDAAMNAAIQNANIRTNKANTLLNAKLRALGWRRDDIANWENNLGSNLTNLFENIGNIGLENYNRNTVMSNPSLYYYTDDEGTVHYKKGLSKKQKDAAKKYAKENNLQVEES